MSAPITGPYTFKAIGQNIVDAFKTAKNSMTATTLADAQVAIKHEQDSILGGLRNTARMGTADAYNTGAKSWIDDLLGPIDITKQENQNLVGKILKKSGSSHVEINDKGNYILKDGWENEQLKLGFWNKAKLAHTDLKTGDYDAGKVAASGLATYMTGATMYRLGSGGGFYRDKDGNTDIIGVPFI